VGGALCLSAFVALHEIGFGLWWGISIKSGSMAKSAFEDQSLGKKQIMYGIFAPLSLYFKDLEKNRN
jgi:hypothetical protein